MKTIIAILLALSLSGCATYKAVTASPLLEASVRVAVGRVLDNQPAWVAPAYQFTRQALELVSKPDIASVGAIDDLFLQAIAADLTPEEQDLALSLFISIKEAIITDLDRRGINQPQEQRVYVLQALTWINQSAAVRMQ